MRLRLTELLFRGHKKGVRENSVGAQNASDSAQNRLTEKNRRKPCGGFLYHFLRLFLFGKLAAARTVAQLFVAVFVIVIIVFVEIAVDFAFDFAEILIQLIGIII